MCRRHWRWRVLLPSQGAAVEFRCPLPQMRRPGCSFFQLNGRGLRTRFLNISVAALRNCCGRPRGFCAIPAFRPACRVRHIPPVCGIGIPIGPLEDFSGWRRIGRPAAAWASLRTCPRHSPELSGSSIGGRTDSHHARCYESGPLWVSSSSSSEYTQSGQTSHGAIGPANCR